MVGGDAQFGSMLTTDSGWNNGLGTTSVLVLIAVTVNMKDVVFVVCKRVGYWFDCLPWRVRWMSWVLDILLAGDSHPRWDNVVVKTQRSSSTRTFLYYVVELKILSHLKRRPNVSVVPKWLYQCRQLRWCLMLSGNENHWCEEVLWVTVIRNSSSASMSEGEAY